MKRFVLSLLIMVGGWGAAQDVARAASPSAEVLWDLFGSISSVEVEVQSPEVKNILVVSMYRGRAVNSDTEDVNAERRAGVTLSAGALDPGVGRECPGVSVFIHHRWVGEGGGFGSGMSRRCVPVEDVRSVRGLFRPSPLNRPPELYVDQPQVLPVNTWLLFGATELIPTEREREEEELDGYLAHYFLLSTDVNPPHAEEWELPTYETWREATDAFDAE